MGKRIQAKWKRVKYEDIMYCSNCNCRLVDEQLYISLNYCPKCGAKMGSKIEVIENDEYVQKPVEKKPVSYVTYHTY